MFAFKGPVWTRHPFGGEQRGKNTITGGKSSCRAFPERKLAGARVTHGNIGDCNNGDGFSDLLRWQAKQMADTGCGSDTSCKALIPTFITQSGGVTDADEELVRDDHG